VIGWVFETQTNKQTNKHKWQIWDRKRKTCFSPSRIVTFLPVQKRYVPAGAKCDVFREGCDKKTSPLKKIVSCAKASHSSQKCDQCDKSDFLSPKRVTNVTSLTQIWDRNLGRNSAKISIFLYIVCLNIGVCDCPLQNNNQTTKYKNNTNCGSAFEPGASGLPYYCACICVRSWCNWRAISVDSKPKKTKKGFMDKPEFWIQKKQSARERGINTLKKKW